MRIEFAITVIGMIDFCSIGEVAKGFVGIVVHVVGIRTEVKPKFDDGIMVSSAD